MLDGTNLNAALAYEDRGLSVIPLQQRSKEPHHRLLRETRGTPERGSLTRLPAKPDEIREWFSLDPRMNIGIGCGSTVVVDLDDPLTDVSHPSTPICRTSRGRHIYVSSEISQNTVKAPWGQVCGKGTYVVAPPSTHPSGHIYEWSKSIFKTPLADISKVLIRDPARGYLSLVLVWGIYRGHNKKQREAFAHARTHPHTHVHAHTHTRAREGALSGDESAVEAAMSVLGISAQIGKLFRCVLPGHAESHSSAAVFRGDHGEHRYHDFHIRTGREWYSLAEVYASVLCGYEVELDAPSASYWWDRLFWEAKVIEEVEKVPLWLPDGANQMERQVAEGFSLLWALRSRRETGPAPYTRRFACSWCGVSEWEARKAIRRLRDWGSIRKVGEYQIGMHQMDLFIPGWLLT